MEEEKPAYKIKLTDLIPVYGLFNHSLRHMIKGEATIDYSLKAIKRGVVLCIYNCLTGVTIFKGLEALLK